MRAERLPTFLPGLLPAFGSAGAGAQDEEDPAIHQARAEWVQALA